MFIGDLVRLKDDVMRKGENEEFVKNALKEDWIWLITSMDKEDLDYIIQPLYLDPDNKDMIQLGKELLVLYDEIEIVEMNREELFEILNEQGNQF